MVQKCTLLGKQTTNQSTFELSQLTMTLTNGISFIHPIFSGKSHPKSTKENPIVDFDACAKLVKDKTMHLVDPKPITLNQNQIATFSYFFERAIETGLVG